ncbi:lysosome membrane protein 2c isoform X2 [Latimeria chalumnae]|uniref:lysosome membrane protein 2c isoform X2 n=1 Tax=Latimeria chalumnae TaxID=7897 RepID=UPI0006D902A7|nr:PREDICTED: lysosome membrane protein 2-like [Latimeria chalumnae]|eukprot:XP_014339299.1 PREDICTED: lysosome membrane protein 2-like [Latimeria chalumnae]
MKKCCLYVFGVLAVLLVIVSVVFLGTHSFQKVVGHIVKQETVLKNGTQAFETWRDPPSPIYMQFYFFNLTNPKEVLAGETPFVEEKGPYTYREYRSKEDVRFLDNDTKVSSVTPKSYVFVPEMSVGDPALDLIRTVNIPVVTVMEMSKNSVFKSAIKVLITTTGETLFMTHTVNELLWGYRDTLLSLIHPFVKTIDEYFGLFYKMNGTDDGDYVILSGEQKYQDLARIVEWNGNKSLHWWTTDMCNMINGTDAASFHPLITKDESIPFFSSDLCRSLYATFDSNIDVKGISAFRFVPPPDVFANATLNPANDGFCVPAGNCLGSGVLNVSVCKQGAPIIMSSPHFYQADPKYKDAISGMNPNKENHQTFLDINPLTGILVRGAKRVQVNVHVEKLDAFPITQDIKTLIFPVMYLNESVLIDDASAGKLKSALLQAHVIVNTPYMIMALGILFGIIFIVLVWRDRGRKEEGTEDERASLIRTS